MSEFIGYVGPREIHDAVIEQVIAEPGTLSVVLRVADPGGHTLQIEFDDPSDVEDRRAVGMMLFALAERASEGGRRRFSFVNWDETDDAGLDLSATNVRW